MKHIYLFFLSLIISVFSFSQISLNATGGTANASYTTLKAAFDAINNGVHTGIITINITGNTTETATAALEGSGTTFSSYLLVNINTTAVPYTISGNIAGPLIQFNGADSINFNGNNQLTLNNTNTTGMTLNFINDASAIVVRNMTIKGATASATSGVVNFGLGPTGGNDRITLDNCNIDGTGLATTCIYSTGTALVATPLAENNGDTVRNCRIYDWFTQLATPVGVNLNAGNSGWVFIGNSLYQTVNRSTSFQAPMIALQIFPSFTNDFHTVSGNFVGGTSVGANGTFTFTATGTNVVGYIGINVQTGGDGNRIINNTVRNVNSVYATTLGSFTNAGISTFIGGYDGITEITENNISNLNITNTLGNCVGVGINCNGRVTSAGALTFPEFYISGNNISNMTYVSGGASGAITGNGIRLETSSVAGLTVTAIANVLFIVDGNTISNLTTTFNGPSGIRGIQSVNTQGSAARLFPVIGAYDNTITGLSANSTTAGWASPAVAGLFLQGSAGANDSLDTHEVFGNIISNLSNNNATDVGTSGIGNVVTGIHGTAGAYRIMRNKIFDLRNSQPGILNNPGILGISVRTLFDTTTVANNFISLGAGLTSNSTIYGIINHLNTGRLVNVFYNSVIISGTGAGANTRGSAALARDTANLVAITTPFNVKNNILINKRTGGVGLNYAMVLAQAPPTNFSSNYNDFYTGTATPISYNNLPSSLAAYQLAATQDANSKSLDVNWANPATADLHLAGASVGDFNLAGLPLNTGNTALAGVALTQVNADFDVQTRPAVNPYIGADEAATPLPTLLTSFSANRSGKVNILNWSTAQEINTLKFIVERSNNGRDFTNIGEVAAAGNSQSPRNYQFTDNSPVKGINYYRIRTVDIDNSGRYSIVRSVKNAGAGLISLFPIPANDIAHLSIDADKSEIATIVITDMKGAQMYHRTFIISEGNNLLPIDLSAFAKGYYTMFIKLDNETFIQKLSKL